MFWQRRCKIEEYHPPHHHQVSFSLPLSLSLSLSLYIYIYIYIYYPSGTAASFLSLSCYPYLPTSPLGQDMTHGQFLSEQVWIQSFPSPRLVASPRLKKPVCPTILPIAGGRIIGFIPFPRVLVLCEMQSVSSRIWTRVAVSISYDDNHYHGHLSFLLSVPIIHLSF